MAKLPMGKQQQRQLTCGTQPHPCKSDEQPIPAPARLTIILLTVRI
ncbi:MAG: hypothetical protein QM629_07320 [Parafilimonas sp.]